MFKKCSISTSKSSNAPNLLYVHPKKSLLSIRDCQITYNNYRNLQCHVFSIVIIECHVTMSITYNDYRNLHCHVSSIDIIECHLTMSVTYNDCKKNLQ